MNKGQSKNNLASIEIVPYDDSWVEKYENERQVLARALSDCVLGTIEHVGSTAVPGLAAKPIIDIMVGVESLSASKPAFEILEGLQYGYRKRLTHVMHFFRKPGEGKRVYNLQLVPYLSDCWVKRIAFRDHLRAHAEVAQAYAVLKHQLSKQYAFDGTGYNEAKSQFIRSTVQRALARTERSYTTVVMKTGGCFLE